MDAATPWLTSATYSPDGRRVVTTGGEGSAALWDGATGERLGSIAGLGPPLDLALFGPDSKALAVATDSSVLVFDAATLAFRAKLEGHEGPVTAMAFSPDGSRLLTGSKDKSAALWDVASGRMIAYYRGHAGPIHLVAHRPDGRQVATASEDGTVRLWPVDLIPTLQRLAPRDLKRSSESPRTTTSPSGGIRGNG